MFNQNNEEKKLDWMYKGANSLVDRDEYLLGRSVDKTLEQLNDEEKQKQQGLMLPPKNRVEHECIPPSIRDFNKVVQAEQVDLSAKLQEDPLVTIKKREEESRREFLQNPVQLKKLQKALKAQQAKNDKKSKKKKKKKKKKKAKDSDDDSESDLNAKLVEKLLGKKNKKIGKDERNLDTILIHKYEEFKDKLTESDIQDILAGKITDSESSEEEEDEDEKRQKKSSRKRRYSSASNGDNSDEEDDKRKKNVQKKQQENNRQRSDYKYRYPDNYKRQERQEHSKKEMVQSRNRYKERDDYHRKRSEHSREDDRRKDEHSCKDKKRSEYSHRDDQRNKKHRNRDKSRKSSDSSSSSEDESSDSDSHNKKKKLNYGLVNSDGKKIHLSKNHDHKKGDAKSKPKAPEPPPVIQKHRAKKLTDEQKEKLRQEMMQNAAKRDKERAWNVRKYRETEEKEKREQDFDPEFIHKQLLKSNQTSSVESRIKSNLNNIQRSSRDMDRNFSKR